MDKVDHGHQLALDDARRRQHWRQPIRVTHRAVTPTAGVALKRPDGIIYAGRYAENAAFNPSLPPLQARADPAELSGDDCLNIRRAVLVEPQEAISASGDATAPPWRR